jgi:hypothetical protein
LETASGEAGRDGPSGSNASSVLRFARRPEIVGPVGALLGFCIGVVIGRESIPTEPASRKAKAVESKRAAATPASEAAEATEEEAPGQEYRRQLGARLPKDARGFEPTSAPGRRVAKVADKEAKLPFELEPLDEEYALTAIVYADPDNRAELQVQLDGQPLAPAKLTDGWNVYYSALPRGPLAQPRHELSFRVDRGEPARIGFESLAIAPIESEMRFSFGPKAIGMLLEGFSKPGGESSWSDGPRSVLAIPLAPEPVDYRLTVRAGALSRLAPLTVTAKVNGTDLGTAVFAKKVTENSWAVPAKTIKAGPNRVEFSYPETARPTEYNPNSQDTRLLALRFYNVALQPDR